MFQNDERGTLKKLLQSIFLDSDSSEQLSKVKNINDLQKFTFYIVIQKTHNKKKECITAKIQYCLY